MQAQFQQTFPHSGSWQRRAGLCAALLVTVLPLFGQPTITAPPQNQSVVAGGRATFTVEAVGTPPLSYQWRTRAGTRVSDIPGAIQATLELTDVQPPPRLLAVVVTDAGGSVMSSLVRLDVLAITAPPASQAADVGAAVTFSVNAVGALPLAYQWRKDGIDMTGQKRSLLRLRSVQLEDSGAYSVAVSNGAGVITSAAAQLNVVPGRSSPFAFEFVRLLKEVNSTAMDASPRPSMNGLELYFSSRRLGGQGDVDIWVAQRDSLTAAFVDPVNLGPQVNTRARDDSPFLSSDGLSLYFSDEAWFEGSPHRPGGLGGGDIWVASRPSSTSAWETPVNPGAPINSRQLDESPTLTEDRLELYFGSTRGGGHGSVDLWGAHRASADSPWETPFNLGPNINTGAVEAEPDVSSDGLALVFSSDRSGELTLWVSVRASRSARWPPAIKLSPFLHRAASIKATPAFSSDGSSLFFLSQSGDAGDEDLWEARVASPRGNLGLSTAGEKSVAAFLWPMLPTSLIPEKAATVIGPWEAIAKEPIPHPGRLGWAVSLPLTQAQQFYRLRRP